VSLSMPEDQRVAYAKALHFAVIERNLTFAVGDQFADWHIRIGRHQYDDLDMSLEHWLSSPHHRPSREDQGD
jgi:hypothetical protein